jgi:phage head maturation protease
VRPGAAREEHGSPVTHPSHYGSYDEEEFSITFPFAASHGRDRGGDFLEVGGIDTANHRRNPVVFLDHGKNFQLPIGKTEDRRGNYTVTIDRGRGLAVATVFLSRHLPEARQVFQLWKEGILRAGSIGYRPVRATRLPRDPEHGLPEGLHLQRTGLLEPSIVGLPMNADTVRKVLDGRQLSPALAQCVKSWGCSPSGLGRAVLRRRAWPTYDLDEAEALLPVVEAVHCEVKALGRVLDRVEEADVAAELGRLLAAERAFARRLDAAERAGVI